MVWGRKVKKLSEFLLASQLNWRPIRFFIFWTVSFSFPPLSLFGYWFSFLLGIFIPRGSLFSLSPVVQDISIYLFWDTKPYYVPLWVFLFELSTVIHLRRGNGRKWNSSILMGFWWNFEALPLALFSLSWAGLGVIFLNWDVLIGEGNATWNDHREKKGLNCVSNKYCKW